MVGDSDPLLARELLRRRSELWYPRFPPNIQYWQTVSSSPEFCNVAPEDLEFQTLSLITLLLKYSASQAEPPSVELQPIPINLSPTQNLTLLGLAFSVIIPPMECGAFDPEETYTLIALRSALFKEVAHPPPDAFQWLLDLVQALPIDSRKDYLVRELQHVILKPVLKPVSGFPRPCV